MRFRLTRTGITSLLISLGSAGLTFATLPIVTQLSLLCGNIKSIVPIVAVLMFITAGAVYAAGQIMGAETRARANVWSTAMLVGGIIGLVIAASAGYLLQIFAQAALGTGGGVTIGQTVTC